MIEIERPNIITVDLSEDGKHGTLSSNPLNAVMALPWELAQKGSSQLASRRGRDLD